MQNKGSKYTFGRIFWLMILALIAALIIPGIAYAESEQPPPEEAPTEESISDAGETELIEVSSPVNENLPVKKSCSQKGSSVINAASSEAVTAPTKMINRSLLPPAKRSEKASDPGQVINCGISARSESVMDTPSGVPFMAK